MHIKVQELLQHLPRKQRINVQKLLAAGALHRASENKVRDAYNNDTACDTTESSRDNDDSATHNDHCWDDYADSCSCGQIKNFNYSSIDINGNDNSATTND